MKFILSFFLMLSSMIAFGQKSYYLSPSGNDNNTGTINSPWFTLKKAWSSIASGDTIYMRGGTYPYAIQQDLLNRNGTAAKPICLWAYPGEKPYITGASNYLFEIGLSTDLIYFEGSYVHFKGLEIANFKQKPDQSPWFGFRAGYMQNCIVENINYHDNGSAFSIRGDGTGNLVLNSDFYRNQDPYSAEPYDGADGLAIGYNNNQSAVNTVRGCRFYWNADDGLDLWLNKGYVLVENCWSFYNGFQPGTFNVAGNGTGFKLGVTEYTTTVVKRDLRNCVAFKNRNWGFCENNALVNMTLYNNTAVNNGIWNYWFGSWGASPKTFKNNTSMGGSTMWDTYGYALGTDAIESNNRWNSVRSDYASMDSTQLLNTRQSNGYLPTITFLTPSTNSPLINTGANVGLPYNGSAPDIGAFESGGQVVVLPNVPPVANAGDDKTITLPTSQVTLVGSGIDTDGTITSYQWTKVSGPTTFTLGSPTLATTTVSSLVQGIYQFELRISDNSGAVSKDTVNVLVNASVANIPPVANAGADKTITLPTSQVTLVGAGTDVDGTIVSYQWSNSIGTTWNGQSVIMSTPVSGVYTYTLTVTDDKGAVATDQVTVTVNPAPRTVLVTIHVYSDKTVSTATRVNATKTLVCDVRVYSDGSIERIR